MKDVYLITAIHEDGSRRQWAGKRPVFCHTQLAGGHLRVDMDWDDPYFNPATHYIFTPLANLPDCITKDKALIQ